MSDRTGPVCYRARSDLRARWRTLVTLSLLLAAVAGALIACLAAARRTDSAFDRLRIATAAADLYVTASCPSSDCPPDVGAAEARRMEALAGVRAAATIRLYFGRFETADGAVLQESAGGSGEITVVASADSRWGDEIDRPQLVSGRTPDPEEPLEVMVDKELARSRDLAPGDVVRYTPDSGHDSDDAGTEEQRGFALEIVGVALAPIGVRPQSGDIYVSVIFAGSAFVTELGELGDTGLAVALEPDQDVSALAGTEFADRAFIDVDEKAVQIDGGTDGDSLMLVLIAVLGTVGAALVLTPVVARTEAAVQRDAPVLRTLGFTRRDLVVRGAIHGVVLGTLGGAGAAAIAVALSPLAPIAEARRFEPDRGLDVDLGVVVAGAVMLAVVAAAVVTIASWRAVGRRPIAPPRRSSTLARLLGSRRIGPVGSMGLRLGLGTSGAGSNAGYFVAIALAGAVVAGAITFAGALAHLEQTPRLVGTNFDIMLFPPDGEDPRDWAESTTLRLLEDPDVDVASAGTFFPTRTIVLGDQRAETWLVTYQAGPRALEPVVVSGRAPAAAHELLIHPDLIDVVGGLGDTIVVSATRDGMRTEAGEASGQYTIVGTGVITIEGLFKSSSAMTYEGLVRLHGAGQADELAPQMVQARFYDGVDRERAFARLEQAGLVEGGSLVPTTGSKVERERRVEVNPARDLVRLDLDGLGRVPRALALLLGTLGACVLATMIGEKTRSWGSRLAIHRALGLTRWQVRGGVIAAAILTCTGAFIAGVLLGVLAGTALWARQAENLGVVTEVTIPAVDLGLALVGAIAVAVAMAARPAWVASRREVAASLRAE